MNKRILMAIIALLVLFVIGAALYAQSNSLPPCYSISFGLEVRPEAQAILDAQGYLVPNIENAMHQTLARHQQMTGECFAGELGMIYDTEPRVFAVFQSTLNDYGVLRIMTEQQYYPPPFDENSVGWQYNEQ
jgi:hypothetical protein